VTVTDIEAGDDRISFDVDQIGQPVLVRASYFPNWDVDGARGPYRVAPNLMVVIPTEEHVELHYGWTPVDLLAWLLTALGLGGLFLLARRPPVVVPPPPEPVATSVFDGPDDAPSVVADPGDDPPDELEPGDEAGDEVAPDDEPAPEPDQVPVGAAD
jgi:hypothetical protein